MYVLYDTRSSEIRWRGDGPYRVDGSRPELPDYLLHLEVVDEPRPEHDASRQRLVREDWRVDGETWRRSWAVVDLTASEVKQRRLSRIEAEAQSQLEELDRQDRRIDRIEAMLARLVEVQGIEDSRLVEAVTTFRERAGTIREVERIKREAVESAETVDELLRPDPWIQPQGADVPGFSPYNEGDTVWHNGQAWESTTPDNVWEPGVSGWRSLSEGDEPAAWVQPTGAHDAYQTGDRVTHRRTIGGDGIWVWESAIDGNTTEPGTDGTFDRWWTPVRAV